MKLKRNDPCHCGSGDKYKKCCLPADEATRSAELAAAQAQEATDADAVAEAPPPARGQKGPAPVRENMGTRNQGSDKKGPALIRRRSV